MYETGQFSEIWFWNEIDKRDDQIRKLEDELNLLKQCAKNLLESLKKLENNR